MTVHQLFTFRFAFDVADRLRKVLRVADLSVQCAADLAGVHRNVMSAWLNGRAKPTAAQLAPIAAKTGAPLEWIMTGNLDVADLARPKALLYSA